MSEANAKETRANDEALSPETDNDTKSKQSSDGGTDVLTSEVKKPPQKRTPSTKAASDSNIAAKATQRKRKPKAEVGAESANATAKESDASPKIRGLDAATDGSDALSTSPLLITDGIDEGENLAEADGVEAEAADEQADSEKESVSVAPTEQTETEAQVTAEASDGQSELSSQTDAEAADGMNESEPGSVSEPTYAEAYEISFFGPDVPRDYGSDEDQPSVSENSEDENASQRDADQLSFFEDDAKPTIPDAPKEIPLFIPKPPKDGAVARKRAYNPDKPRGADTAFDFIELFIISLVAVLILTSFFFRHSMVVGDSMMNTLQDGEHLIISDAFYTPQRGDIVVIEDKSIDLQGTDEAHYALVKRVIAIEGDHIVINSYGEVYLNGELLDEDYVYIDGPIFESRIDMVVPKGEIFVMGDHRNNSTDSRRFGTVKVDCVIGRALIRVYPFEKFGKVE